jgi:GDP-L-fucose synthase
VKAIVLGATGLIGNAIWRRLKTQDWDVSIFSSKGLDLRSSSDFLKLDFKADVIFHAVECLKNISSVGVPDLDQVLDNVIVDINVVKSWRKYQPQARLIAFSSLWAYPAGEIFYPEDFDCGPPVQHQYGAAKRLLIRSVAGLNACVLTLPNVYGPGDRSSRIVPTVLKQMLRKEDLYIKTSGTERRNFAYVDDVAKAAVNSFYDIRSGVFHVAASPSTIREMVATAQYVTKHVGQVKYGIQSGDTRLLCSYDRGAYTSLENGLRETILAMKVSSNV